MTKTNPCQTSLFLEILRPSREVNTHWSTANGKYEYILINSIAYDLPAKSLEKTESLACQLSPQILRITGWSQWCKLYEAMPAYCEYRDNEENKMPGLQELLLPLYGVNEERNRAPI